MLEVRSQWPKLDALQVHVMRHSDLPGDAVQEDVLQVRAHSASILHALYKLLPLVLVLALQPLRLPLQHTCSVEHILTAGSLLTVTTAG